MNILTKMTLQKLEAALDFQEHYEERVAETAQFLRTKLGGGESLNSALSLALD